MASVAEVKENVEEAKKLRELAQTVESLKKKLTETEGRLAKTEKELDETVNQLTELQAESESEDAELAEEIDENGQKIATNRRKVNAGFKSLKLIKQYSDSELKSRIKSTDVAPAASDYMADTLTVRASYRPSEPLIETALREFEKTFENTRKPLADFIVEKGIASEVREVTKYLSQRKTTALRKKLWAIAYDKTLFDLLEKHKSDIDELETVVDDTHGLAQKVMAKFEEPNGPVDQFAKSIYELTKKRNHLTPDPEVDDQVPALIKSRLL